MTPEQHGEAMLRRANKVSAVFREGVLHLLGARAKATPEEVAEHDAEVGRVLATLRMALRQAAEDDDTLPLWAAGDASVQLMLDLMTPLIAHCEAAYAQSQHAGGSATNGDASTSRSQDQPLEQPMVHSQQAFAMTPPAEEAQYLSCCLECVTCGSRRTYRLTQNLHALVARAKAHLRVQARCEECLREIGITLFWDPRESQYSYAHLPLGEEVQMGDGQPLKVGEKNPI